MEWSRGITFGTQCDATGLHQLVDSATAANAAIADFMSTQLPIYVGSPLNLTSANVGQLVWDNTINGDVNPCGILLYFDGAIFRPVSGYYIKNVSASTINFGDVVVFASLPASAGETVLEVSSTALKVSACTSVANPLVVGVSTGSIAAGAYGYAVSRGVIVTNINPTVIQAAVLLTSATTGFASASSPLVAKGAFGRVLDNSKNICLITGLMKGT